MEHKKVDVEESKAFEGGFIVFSGEKTTGLLEVDAEIETCELH